MAAKRTVLLVDDDPDFLEINRHVLEARGYAVRCFSSPQEALDQMVREKPDLVISDLMMRSLDTGFSLSRKIKDDPRFADVPVLIVTGISSRLGFDFAPRSAEELAAMRADAYLEKPTSPQLLIEKVEALLEPRAGKDQP